MRTMGILPLGAIVFNSYFLHNSCRGMALCLALGTACTAAVDTWLLFPLILPAQQLLTCGYICLFLLLPQQPLTHYATLPPPTACTAAVDAWRSVFVCCA
mmetsp:Transcript_14381/g.38972  ORF Transcript_14381/g.38972 Transcript_14381/m.38972 type:complete len:100 (+) Transcript_14381:1109-1408(+)